MRLRTAALSLALLASSFAVSPPAHAGGRGLLSGLRAWQRHNGSADRDERISLREFRQQSKSGVVPMRLSPSSVIARKLERAEQALARLRMAARSSRHQMSGGLIIGEGMSGTLRSLNELNAALLDVQRYATLRGVAVPARLRSAAREALDEARWHLDAHPPAGGLGSYGVVVAGARESEKLLGAMAGAE